MKGKSHAKSKPIDSATSDGKSPHQRDMKRPKTGKDGLITTSIDVGKSKKKRPPKNLI